MQPQDKHKYNMFEMMAGCHFVLGPSAPYLLIQLKS